MEATIVKTTGACSDTTLRRINEAIFTVLARGDKSGFITLNIEKSAAVTLKFLSNTGAFYDAVNGNNLGQTLVTPSSGSHNVFIKVSAETKMSVYNCKNVLGINSTSFSSNANSPVLKIETFQLSNFYNAYRFSLSMINLSDSLNYLSGLPNLISVNFFGGKYFSQTDIICAVTGNISSLPNKATATSLGFYDTAVIIDLAAITTATYPLLTSLIATGSNLVNFDLVNLANNKIDTLNSDSQATGITYSGNTTAFSTKTFKEIYVQGCTLSTAQIDNMIIASAGATWSGNKKLYLKGTRTSASDAAVATLKANGVTVNVNGVTL